MVVAVRCPNAECRKYQLVEEHDRGQIVACLICGQSIKVPAANGEWEVNHFWVAIGRIVGNREWTRQFKPHRSGPGGGRRAPRV